ncbi:MAG: hypothetical protein QM706_06940 [Nitrospira sp.]
MDDIYKAIIGEGLDVMRKSLLASICIAAIGLLVGWYGTRLYYLDQLNDQNERMERIKITAGMAQPSPETGLTQYTNSELKIKAAHVMERIREVLTIHEQHRASIIEEKQDHKIKVEQWKIRMQEESRRAWKQFEPTRVDALLVADELRARLPSNVRDRVFPESSPFTSTDGFHSKASMSRLASEPFNLQGAYSLAAELEELSKLQLSQLKTCSC